MPWHGKAATGKCFMAQPAAARAEGREMWGCLPATRDAAPQGHPGFLPRALWHLGEWGVSGASGGQCARAALARRQRDSLPERQLPRSSVSKGPRRCLQTVTAEPASPGPCPQGLGRVCTLPPAKESWEAASEGAGPRHLGWQTRQPVLEWEAAKPGLAQCWQRLKKATRRWLLAGWDVAVSKGNAQLRGLSRSQPQRRRGSQPALHRLASWLSALLPIKHGEAVPVLVLNYFCVLLARSPHVLSTGPGMPVGLGEEAMQKPAWPVVQRLNHPLLSDCKRKNSASSSRRPGGSGAA